MDIERIGQIIVERRELLGITQSKLAEMVGMTRTNLSNIENAKQSIPTSTLLQILSCLGLEMYIEKQPPLPIDPADYADRWLLDALKAKRYSEALHIIAEQMSKGE